MDKDIFINLLEKIQKHISQDEQGNYQINVKISSEDAALLKAIDSIHLKAPDSEIATLQMAYTQIVNEVFHAVQDNPNIDFIAESMHETIDSVFTEKSAH